MYWASFHPFFLESAKIGAGEKFPSSLRVGVFLVASQPAQASSGRACTPSHTPSLGPLPQETVWGGGSSGTWAGGSREVRCFILYVLGLLMWFFSLLFTSFGFDCVGKRLVLLIDLLWRLSWVCDLERCGQSCRVCRGHPGGGNQNRSPCRWGPPHPTS